MVGSVVLSFGTGDGNTLTRVKSRYTDKSTAEHYEHAYIQVHGQIWLTCGLKYRKSHGMHDQTIIFYLNAFFHVGWCTYLSYFYTSSPRATIAHLRVKNMEIIRLMAQRRCCLIFF